MSTPNEVIIDGVRYVPASQAVAGLDDLRRAMEDVFWGKGYSPQSGDRSAGLFVQVHDDGEGTELNEFMDQIAADLASE